MRHGIKVARVLDYVGSPAMPRFNAKFEMSHRQRFVPNTYRQCHKFEPARSPPIENLGTQLRHFLGLEVVHWSGIHAALHNPMRQFLGFIAERRYFVGTR
jgi:hypothetical protein